jgi:LDH2 family malate/lactate/ureidoglycolate dehydrogenase
MAMELAIRKARTAACASSARAVPILRRRGPLRLAGRRENLIGLCTTNSALWLAPTGG